MRSVCEEGFFFIICTCHNKLSAFSGGDENDYIYPVGKNKIVTVCVIDEQHDQNDASMIAKKRGVDWLCSHGFNFIKIDSEEKITLFTAPSHSQDDSVYSDNFSQTLPEQNFPDQPSSIGDLATAAPAVMLTLLGLIDDPNDPSYFTCSQQNQR